MFWVIAIIIVLVAIVKASTGISRQNDLKRTYDEALRGTDKSKALHAGREYYSSLRSKNQLTVYDEQAITNDLSTMGSNVKLLTQHVEKPYHEIVLNSLALFKTMPPGSSHMFPMVLKNTNRDKLVADEYIIEYMVNVGLVRKDGNHYTITEAGENYK